MAAESALAVGMSLGAEAEYLRGVESSTCLLLAASPSPTPDAPQPQPHPLSDVALFTTDDDGCVVQLQEDSSSSGDSGSAVLQQDPVSAQLINNISMLDYHTLSKADHLIAGQDVECKVNGNTMAGSRKLPNFVKWNWKMVRKVLLWIVVSALIACTGVVVAIIATLPTTCNPSVPWYQGTVFYEVFPASFKNTNNDAFGDLKGLIEKLDYIRDLGASTVRLNYIFQASEYPERYTNVTDLMSIDRNIGTMNDFQDVVAAVHARNMSLVLDVPAGGAEERLAGALTFWAAARRVDGFYLKGLENSTADARFETDLRHWKRVIGPGKILMVSEETYQKSAGSARSALLSEIDLVDVQLNVAADVETLKKQIREVVGGALFSERSQPSVHWSVGGVDSERLASARGRDAPALLLLALVLPGTVSLFYGDEIGLRGLDAAEPDFHERAQVHQLVAMQWEGEGGERGGVLPWNGDGGAEADSRCLAMVRAAADLRRRTPTLYVSAVDKAGERSATAQVRESGEGTHELVVVERWLSRRHSYVYVGNPAPHARSADLSTLFYAGAVVAATDPAALHRRLYFHNVTLAPHEALVVKLDK